MGSGTNAFLRFLADAKQSIWQILPLGPTDPAFSNSPYMSVSAFAGNPLLISPQLLQEDGLLNKSQLQSIPSFSQYSVDFSKVISCKKRFLSAAYTVFKSNKNDAFNEFVSKSSWLADYCLFMTLKNAYPGKSWYQWDNELVQRKPNLLAKLNETHKEQIEYFQFEQFIFQRQWQKIRQAAREHNIDILGDIPIYVSLDSADVWAHQEIFKLDPQTGRPTHVAGVPPDYFSKTGQKWGNPLYTWNTEDQQVKDRLLEWWINRFKHVYEYVDLARIDHFRGFESYWSVPAQNTTALRGTWEKGPGAQFFKKIFSRLGSLNIVAEDLGEITDEVIALRNSLGFPGMRILQFAFDGNPDNSYLPYNYETQNTYVYTGTHDNDTTLGWYLDKRLDDNLRVKIKKMANRDIHDNSGIHSDLIYLAMSSVANVSIFPLQDILGFGSDCRMNTPGTIDNNWLWRCSDEFLTKDVSQWLKELTQQFGREIKTEAPSSGKEH